MLLFIFMLHTTRQFSEMGLVNSWALWQGCGLQRQVCSLGPDGILALLRLRATAAVLQAGQDAGRCRRHG